MAHKIKNKSFNLTEKIIAFEEGTLDDDQTIELFQHLVDTGMAWRLRGMYGRTAMSLIEQGLVKKPKVRTRENSTDYYGNRLY